MSKTYSAYTSHTSILKPSECLFFAHTMSITDATRTNIENRAFLECYKGVMQYCGLLKKDHLTS
eukprot:c13222_g1_i2 orf=1-189(-)